MAKKKKIKKAANVSGFWKQTAKSTKKNYKKLSKAATPVYSRYAAPTVGLFKQTGKLAMNIGKLALRAPGTALALPLVYAGAKHIGKKAGRKFSYPGLRQFDKRGRKFI
jgi:hypothetical protein